MRLAVRIADHIFTFLYVFLANTLTGDRFCYLLYGAGLATVPQHDPFTSLWTVGMCLIAIGVLRAQIPYLERRIAEDVERIKREEEAKRVTRS